MCFFKRKKQKEEVKEVVVEQKQVKEEVAKPPVKEEKVEPKEKKVEPKALKVKETSKKEVKEEVKEKEASDKFAYHITQVKDEKSEFYKMWRVRRSGSDKVIKHFKTQKEAIEEAKKYAEGNKDASIVIHRVDGKIRKQKY